MSKTPNFTTTVDVEANVTISADELEEAGWIYGGTREERYEADALEDAIHRWHDRNHTDPWRWCQHELCDEIRRGR